MERFKTFLEKGRIRRKKNYNRSWSLEGHTEENFKDWVSSKLQRPITEYLGSGMEGMVYEIDRFRVIKFLCLNVGTNWSTLSRIKDKNIPGVIKVYSMGAINLPVRFQYDAKTDTGHYKFFGCPDNKIAYIIMEKVRIDKSLKKFIANLPGEWHNWSIRGLDIEYGLVQWGWEQLRPFIEKFDTDEQEILIQIIRTAKELAKLGMVPADYINGGNWGYNKKGELVLFDFWDEDDSNTGPQPKHEI